MHILALVFWLITTPSISVPSDTIMPCDSIRDPTPDDMNRCADLAFDSANTKLRATIGRLLDYLEPKNRSALQKANEAWLIYRDHECRSVYDSYDGGSGASLAMTGCETDLAEKRQQQLVANYVMDGWAPEPNSACLAYEPDTVILTGRLERHEYPGRPNYESIAKGDESEVGFYLRPDEPICATRNQRDDNVPVADVRLVQLVLDARAYERLKPRLGQHIAIRGTLFHSETGHHHATLLLRVAGS